MSSLIKHLYQFGEFTLDANQKVLLHLESIDALSMLGGIYRGQKREQLQKETFKRCLGNAQIAERLSISEKTVRNHVSNLFDKLGVWTRAQAIVFAIERGFKG